ncbi:MAG: 4-alpha-glucanotransferase [Anaerolineaceae bacterium]|jgi:4-alpha-glucanotransferase
MTHNRNSGILLHPTSLPGPDGIGDLGPEAYRWVNFLHASGTQLWQVLPLGPTGYGDSPYQCFSAIAGNPYLISPILLQDEGLLTRQDFQDRPEFPDTHVDFGLAIDWKNLILDRAYGHFKQISSDSLHQEYEVFLNQNLDWIDEFALFMAIKEAQGGQPWQDWPQDLKFRAQDVLQTYKRSLSEQIDKHRFNQFIFFRQWASLRSYCHEKSVQIVGDMPFVIALDSADVWSHPELFKLDANLNPTDVAGVPPDYFSSTGQLWGNPLYRWEVHQENNFSWWIKRLNAVLKLVDYVRLDHFRGFAAAWHVPYGETTAINGSWIKGPAMELFSAIKAHFPSMPIIAEDLGVITPDVKELRDKFSLPGMKILQFGFSGDPDDDFLPHHYPVNCFAYTGSHDNNTAAGWYEQANPTEQAFALNYLKSTPEEISWLMMRSIWQSSARSVVAPMQDLLNLKQDARMNLPGTECGNWRWRMPAGSLNKDLTLRMHELNLLFSRLPVQERFAYSKKIEGQIGETVKPH